MAFLCCKYAQIHEFRLIINSYASCPQSFLLNPQNSKISPQHEKLAPLAKMQIISLFRVSMDVLDTFDNGANSPPKMLYKSTLF